MEFEFEFEWGGRAPSSSASPRRWGPVSPRLAVEIQWATTWEHRADSAIAPLCGLPSGLPRPVASRDEAEEWESDWKFLAVRRSVERDPRPFIWIDDDIDYFQDGAVSRQRVGGRLPMPSLLIAPEGETGLLPQQLDAVEDFVRRHGGGLEDHGTGEP